jgi:hypothetical protein
VGVHPERALARHALSRAAGAPFFGANVNSTATVKGGVNFHF